MTIQEELENDAGVTSGIPSVVYCHWPLDKWQKKDGINGWLEMYNVDFIELDP